MSGAIVGCNASLSLSWHSVTCVRSSWGMRKSTDSPLVGLLLGRLTFSWGGYSTGPSQLSGLDANMCPYPTIVPWIRQIIEFEGSQRNVVEESWLGLDALGLSLCGVFWLGNLFSLFINCRSWLHKLSFFFPTTMLRFPSGRSLPLVFFQPE